jgi:hypothetical protein
MKGRANVFVSDVELNVKVPPEPRVVVPPPLIVAPFDHVTVVVLIFAVPVRVLTPLSETVGTVSVPVKLKLTVPPVTERGLPIAAMALLKVAVPAVAVRFPTLVNVPLNVAVAPES